MCEVSIVVWSDGEYHRHAKSSLVHSPLPAANGSVSTDICLAAHWPLLVWQGPLQHLLGYIACPQSIPI